MSQKGFLLTFLMFWIVLVSGLWADLASKSWVFESYWPYYQQDPAAAAELQPVWLIGSFLGIQTSTNGGASFGMLQGFQVYFSILGVISLLAILIWLFVFSGWRDRVLTLCLGAISGGILGNMYDRLGFWHQENTPKEHFNHVRDFIHFRLTGVPIFDPWPNFNIADSLLVCGVIVLFVKVLFAKEAKEDSESVESAL